MMTDEGGEAKIELQTLFWYTFAQAKTHQNKPNHTETNQNKVRGCHRPLGASRPDFFFEILTKPRHHARSL